MVTSRSGYVTRRALVDAIGTPVQGSPALTIISAPTGYGKTALLNQWQDRISEQNLVVRIDGANLDSDGLLWQELCSALPIADCRHAPNACKLRVFSWLKGVTQPLVITIDNYHDLTSAALDEQLVQLLETSPLVYLVVSGNYFTILDSPLVTSRVQTRILGAAELQFSEEELLQLRGYGELPVGGTARNMVQKLGRWPQATRLVVKAFTELPEKDAHEYVLKVGSALFETVEHQRLLHLLVLLQGATAEVLQRALHMDDDAFNSMVSPLIDTGMVTRSWVNLTEVLTAHTALPATSAFIPEDVVSPDIIREALVLHAEHTVTTDPPRALRLLVEHGLFAEAEEMVAQNFLQLTSHPLEVYSVLTEHPATSFQDFPILLGLLLTVGAPMGNMPAREIRQLAELIEKEVRRRKSLPDAPMNPVDLTLLLASCRILGKWEDAKESALELELLLSDYQYTIDWEDWSNLPFMYAVASLTGVLVGDLDLAERCAAQGLYISSAESNVAAQVRSNNMLALISSIKGDMGMAKHHLQRSAFISETTRVGAPELSWVNAAIAQAAVALDEGDLRGGLVGLERLEPVWDRIETWKQAVVVETWLTRFDQGSQAAAVKLQQRLDSYNGPLSPHSSAHLMTMLGNLAIYSGDLITAERILRAPMAKTDEVVLARARLELAKGNPRKAHAMLQGIAGGGNVSAWYLSATLLAAVSLLAGDDEGGALETLFRLDLNGPIPSMDVVLSTLPYSLLSRLAAAAQKVGSPQLAVLVHALPLAYRFQEPQVLSGAELRTLRASADGATNREISTRLGLSVNTVKSHMHRIYRKLGVNGRDEMVEVARKQGLL